MAEKISQLEFFSAGQSQQERLPEALAEHYVDIDEYSREDLLRFMQQLAPHINFYASNNAETPVGDWQNFFPFDKDNITEWLSQLGDDTPPHLGLLLSFIELYQHPQKVINQLTGKHLDFYYQDILGLSPNPPASDHAHLIIGLKKNADTTALLPEHVFSAGKDNLGIERCYQPVRTTLVNQAQVVSLKSLYQDKRSPNVLRHAPIANSQDGLGEALAEDNPQWSGFGHKSLPIADIGFAVSSPVLRMQEGNRTITLTCVLASSDDLHKSLKNAFNIAITSSEQWLEYKAITPTLRGNRLSFSLPISNEAEAIVDYDPKIHSYHYDAEAPIIKCTFNTSANNADINAWRNIELKSIAIDVNVTDIETLDLENDLGTLNSQKSFMPFGPEPKKGSRLYIRSEEALSKQLKTLALNVTWLDAPSGTEGFKNHYVSYPTNVSNTLFTANIAFTQLNGQQTNTSKSLFNRQDPNQTNTLNVISAPLSRVENTLASYSKIYQSLASSSSYWAYRNLEKLTLTSPAVSKQQTVSNKSGVITLTLKHDFLHEEYRREYVHNILSYTKSEPVGTPAKLAPPVILNPPYTPTVQKISLSYSASAPSIKVSSNTLADFANDQGRFYHIVASGQYRDHRYIRDQFDFIANKTPTLLPSIEDNAALLIGLSPLNAGDSISILFHVAEGSNDPDLIPSKITWSVLCDNYWQHLSPENMPLDTTQQLLKSGIIEFVIPAQATISNTLLDSGYIWLKAGIKGSSEAMPKLVNIISNAVEVVFHDKGNDPFHLASPLEAGSIAKLKTSISTVKKVSQPFASFSGKMTEQSDAFNTRVSERLRHKDRAISSWDYERLVLHHFPAVYRVKAIPHAKAGMWNAPGNVLLVVIPDLYNKNAVTPLQPRVDSATIAAIKTMLKQRATSQINIDIRNPNYQEIQLSCKVRFHAGFAFNYYQQQLQQVLINALSPWVFSDSEEIQFGGKIYKSVLIDLVEELDYVDYLTDVKLYSYLNSNETVQDQAVITPKSPDTILVSASSHDIKEVE